MKGLSIRRWLASAESSGSLIAWAILIVPVVVVSAAFFPGVMINDMVYEFREVATGDFTNHHAPLIHALWRPLWNAGFGPGWVFLGQVLALVIGAYLVLRAAFLPITAALVTAAVTLSPPVFSNLGTMQRDTWFTALLMLTFGLVVRAAQRPWPARGRFLALALAAAWLALASRQNAAAAVVCACVVIAGLALERRWQKSSVGRAHGRPSRVRALLGAVGGGIALTLALMATQVAASQVVGVRDIHPESTLLIYDLGAISKREQENLFPSDVMSQRGTGVIDRKYHVDAMFRFTFDPRAPIKWPITSAAAESLRDTWWDVVRENPRSYLDARWDLWLRQIGVTRDAMLPYGYVDLGNFPQSARGIGLTRADLKIAPIRFPRVHEAAMSYQGAFGRAEDSDLFETINGGPVFTVWVYLLASVAGAAILLRSGRGWPLLAVGALAFAGLTHQVGLFFGAMVTAYRFELPSVVIGIVTAAVLGRLGWERWRATRCSREHAFAGKDV